MTKNNISNYILKANLNISDETYLISKNYVKNIFGIKTNDKLNELAIASGATEQYDPNADNTVGFTSSELSKIADFVGGEKADKLKKAVNELNELDEYKNNVCMNRNEKVDTDFVYKKLNINQFFEFDLDREFDFYLPTNTTLNYVGNNKTTQYYMNTIRYYYYACHNLISNNYGLDSTAKAVKDIPLIFYQDLETHAEKINIEGRNKEVRKKYKENHSQCTVFDVMSMLKIAKKNITDTILDKETIIEDNIEDTFKNKILTNAFLVASTDKALFKVMFKTFSKVQFKLVSGEYSR